MMVWSKKEDCRNIGKEEGCRSKKDKATLPASK